MQQTTVTRIQEIFQKQQAYQWEVRKTNSATRKETLGKLAKALKDNMQEIVVATIQDVQKPQFEVVNEVTSVIGAIEYAIANVEEWMKPDIVESQPGTKAQIMYEPKGVVCILGTWNAPLTVLVHPLAEAIAAGNCAILKPSEHTPTFGETLQKVIASVFDEQEIAVVIGDADVANELLDLPFNHICFTGGTKIGKLVMAAAAKHLASVTLELGGKSPVIVDQGVDLERTAMRLAWGKMINSGQICISPDYVCIHEEDVEAFAQHFEQHVHRAYYDANGTIQNEDRTQIVNAAHYNRLKNLLNDAVEKGAQVLTGGHFDDDTRRIEPTLLTNVTEDMIILHEEIFGPLLLVLPYTDIEEPLAYIRQNPKPLALYIFSDQPALVEHILQSTSSGGVTINDIVAHNTHPNLPFGGVNSSGIGSYHGIHGFKEFSHSRAVFTAVPAEYEAFIMPPYAGKLEMMMQQQNEQ
ncbi:aldehyde dehydrogenase family protein [Lysinibacillus sp. LZ02]|uniref:aldehyde dehydrogenase family protein n=1 Tax=Lysinibacillus sp. LZ02 TaxID=3420668 RepID=UPI003D35A299